MKKVLVVNDSVEDVFSEHLQQAGYEVERQTFLAMISKTAESSTFDVTLILVVNGTLKNTLKIKKSYPDKRVALVTGGKQDFLQPIITVVYGENDYDQLNYSSWRDFDKKLFAESSRPPKLLKFLKAGMNGNHYSLPPVIPLSERFKNEPTFRTFMLEMLAISADYLDWYKSWLDEISRRSFCVKFSSRRKNKKIRRVVIPLENNYQGLPILKEGDVVLLYSQEFEEDSFRGDVIQADNISITVKFSQPLTNRQLISLDTCRPDFAFLSTKFDNLFGIFEHFRNYAQKSRGDYQRRKGFPVRPLDVFASGDDNNENVTRRSSASVFLTKSDERILKDSSQTAALIDIIRGNKFLNFVVGPAGTGKTFVTAVAISKIIERDDRGQVILVASHSNLGVDNLIKALAEILPPEIIFRLGNNIDVIAPFARSFHSRERYLNNFFDDENESNWESGEKEIERQYIQELVKQGKKVVLACTLDSYPIIFNKKWNLEIDTVFIDEASRGLFFEFLPLIMASREQLVFIGDNRQLGNIPLSKEAQEFLQNQAEQSFSEWQLQLLPSFYKGFFNSLLEWGYFSVNHLVYNRRSLTNISQLVSQAFYGGKLIPGRFNPYNPGQIIFYDYCQQDEFKEKREGITFINLKEAAFVVKKFKERAVKHIQKGGKISDLGIIPPYKGQVRLFKKLLRKHLLFHDVLKTEVDPENIDAVLSQLVITVDAIQGGQRKIIFVPLARSNRDYEIGFMEDIRRLNVALSRAQDSLVIVGNSQTFLNCEYPEIQEVFRRIIKFIKAKGIYKKIRFNRQK